MAKQGGIAQEWLTTPTGARLNLYCAIPKERPRAIVIVLHGLTEHAGRYFELMQALAAAGYAAFAPDHRGHGRTEAADAGAHQFAPQGSKRGEGVDLVIADIAAVHDLALQRLGERPVVILGHSMGGLLSFNYALSHARRLAGCAVMNADLQPTIAHDAARILLAWERFRLGSDVGSPLMAKATFERWSRQFEGDASRPLWLSRDAEEVAAFMDDPLCGWAVPIGLWPDILELGRRGGDETRLEAVSRDLPFYLVGGTDDPSTDRARKVEKLAKRLRDHGFRVSSHIYEGARHESLKEINRDEVIDDILIWLSSLPLETEPRAAGGVQQVHSPMP